MPAYDAHERAVYGIIGVSDLCGYDFVQLGGQEHLLRGDAAAGEAHHRAAVLRQAAGQAGGKAQGDGQPRLRQDPAVRQPEEAVALREVAGQLFAGLGAQMGKGYEFFACWPRDVRICMAAALTFSVETRPFSRTWA